MNLDLLEKTIADQPKYRKTQIFEAIYQNLADDWLSLTNLPVDLRQKLNKNCSLKINSATLTSGDKNSIKTLIQLDDGALVETVLMKHGDHRRTVCVSCMVGCPMACTFCATGDMGLSRPLTYFEIVEQVLYFARLLKNEGERVTGVVFMGMGEPLLNYAQVKQAIEIINNQQGLNIGARHISISTCGLLPEIKKFADEKSGINLAISLHGSNDHLRRQLMPVSLTYKLADLMETIDYYIAQTNRKVMFEYLMIDKINDQDENALELAELLKDKLCMVNLIKYNPTGKYKPSSQTRINRFKEILISKGIFTTTRYRFGQDINAACGQLATKRKISN